MINKLYQEIINHLEKAETIAIYMHINPDGDCVGSSLAMNRFLSKLGKTVHSFSANIPNAVPKKLQFLPFSSDINKFTALKKYDVSLGVDVGDAGRLGDTLYKQYLKGQTKIVIDHHEDYVDFADITLREDDAASTTQILYKLLAYWNKELIDEDIATSLYTGLITDSGGFSFANTSPETHQVASELLSYGLDNAEINRKVMKDVEYNVFQLRNRVLSSAQFYNDGKIGIISYNKGDFEKTNTTENDTEGTINIVLNIESVEIAISIAEIEDKKYKISFRTKHKVSAGACAKCFGGGGHFHAAGCRGYGYFEDVYNKILKVSKEMLDYYDVD
jgi:phosphoesterase RecJ-like protein